MSNVTLRQLRTLLAVKKYGKITRAADALGLTSPAVTLQLKQLEQELDNQLFFRTKTGTIPTEAGYIVIDFAERILNELAAMKQQLNARIGLESGTLRVGIVSTGKYFAPRMIAAFNKEFPGIDVQLMTANRSRVVDMLNSHDIDLALMGRPPNNFPVYSTLFGDHPLVFIANPDHPLAGMRNIEKYELAGEKFIIRESGSGTRTSFEMFVGELAHKRPLRLSEMGSNETIKQAVMAGLGVAFISAHTIEQEVESGKLVVLDVEDTPIRRQWYSVRNADRTPTPAMLALDDFLRTKGVTMLPVLRPPKRD